MVSRGCRENPLEAVGGIFSLISYIADIRKGEILDIYFPKIQTN